MASGPAPRTGATTYLLGSEATQLARPEVAHEGDEDGEREVVLAEVEQGAHYGTGGEPQDGATSPCGRQSPPTLQGPSGSGEAALRF